jgi:hypothetical protein
MGELISMHAARRPSSSPATITELPVPTRPSELLASYRFALDTDRPVDWYTKLLVEGLLGELQREIEALLRPAPADFLNRAIAVLGASFKVPSTIENPAAYSAAMRQRLSKFPAAAIGHARDVAPDTEEWMPSIKRMIDLCNEVVQPLERQLRTIEEMFAEHRRRRAEADRQRREEEEAAERAAASEARWRDQFGDAAPLPGDIDLAYRMAGSVRHGGGPLSLHMALDAGEPWAPLLVRRLAVARRAQVAQQNGTISVARAAAITQLAAVDEPGARHQVDEIEAGRLQDPSPGSAGVESFEAAIAAIIGAAGCTAWPARQPPPRPPTLDHAAKKRRRRDEWVWEMLDEARRLTPEVYCGLCDALLEKPKPPRWVWKALGRLDDIRKARIKQTEEFQDAFRVRTGAL